MNEQMLKNQFSKRNLREEKLIILCHADEFIDNVWRVQIALIEKLFI